jgi:alpha-methylacyl-CoA racemase
VGIWKPQRGANILDGGAHFYGTYECSDGKWVSVGAIEPSFYALLLEKMGIFDKEFLKQMEPDHWPALKEKFAVVFRTKTRDEWCLIMEDTDVCFAPVLDMDEAPKYPHNRDRGTFLEIDGVVHPAPAPRFSRTILEVPYPPVKSGEHTEQILRQYGYSEGEIELLKMKKVI